MQRPITNVLRVAKTEIKTPHLTPICVFRRHWRLATTIFTAQVDRTRLVARDEIHCGNNKVNLPNLNAFLNLSYIIETK